MPTGYTAPIVDGKITELKDFVLSCCRAFGACIEMRDDSSDTPIPDEFKPSDYHPKQLQASMDEWARLKDMTGEEAESHGHVLKSNELQSLVDGLARSIGENNKLNAMLNKVNEWAPPTPEHVELKGFMVKQLQISLNGHDYYEKCIKEAQQKPAIHFYNKALDAAAHGVEYHTKRYADEVERAQDRTNWMKAVRASLEAPAK